MAFGVPGMSLSENRHRLTAILGPTNTGKTFMAMERMLAHRSGMIGFPLRLLARENYDRAVAAAGKDAVALVTGEEKILPRSARYFLCTVESMPLDRAVDFLAIDEIQLAADPERGHVFTDRLIRARGGSETMVMGAEAMAPWVKALAPGIEIVSRPRFSNLTHAGIKKITRLPPRSAVVAFSAGDVYAIADLIRRQRGGAAVVMGALSPRTRNAQVALYQSGEVDHLVATDAIGMGLNMDIRHVAFAALRKFDGYRPRPLTSAEIGQIAGRAGRHMTDGTFGTTPEAGPLDPIVAASVEAHRFDPIPYLSWRNVDLDFRSPAALLAALDAAPPHPGLIRQSAAEDHLSLKHLLHDADILALARGPARLRLLWEVCQIPDFRKLMTDAHVRLLGQIYRHLALRGHLPKDWVADQMTRLDRIDGDIDQLMQRIAHARTWSYIAHRGDWLKESAEWQARAQAIEDRLSDALHAALTQRFVDRRHAALHRRRKSGDGKIGTLAEDGAVEIAGHIVGRLVGLRFEPQLENSGRAASGDLKALLSAARQVLAPAAAEAVGAIAVAGDRDFRLSEAGEIEWQGAALARLRRGEEILHPGLALLPNDLIDNRQRQTVEKRLRDWLGAYLRRRLKPLFALTEATGLSAPARGFAYRLGEAFGALSREAAMPALRALTAADRRALRRLGLRFGRETIWVAGLDDPERRRLLGRLAALWLRLPCDARGSPDPAAIDAESLAIWQFASGKRVIAGQAFSFAALEALSRRLAALAAKPDFRPDAALGEKLGLDPATAPAILATLGHRAGPKRAASAPNKKRARFRGRRAVGPDPASPFAALAGWTARRK